MVYQLVFKTCEYRSLLVTSVLKFNLLPLVLSLSNTKNFNWHERGYWVWQHLWLHVTVKKSWLCKFVNTNLWPDNRLGARFETSSVRKHWKELDTWALSCLLSLRLDSERVLRGGQLHIPVGIFRVVGSGCRGHEHLRVLWLDVHGRSLGIVLA